MNIKTLEKQSRVAKQKALTENSKAQKALSQQTPETEIARIHLTSYVRLMNESVRTYRQAKQIEVIVERVESARRTRIVTDSIKKTVRLLDVATKQMNPANVQDAMGAFLTQCEDLDVVEKSYSDATGTIEQQAVGPEGNGVVDVLMAQLMDGRQLDLNAAVREGNVPDAEPVQQQQQKEEGGRVAVPEEVDQNDLQKRLNALLKA